MVYDAGSGRSEARRITARTNQEAHWRAALPLTSLGGQPLPLESLKSDDLEHTDKVEVQAILSSTGRQNSLLEEIVSRLSLEPGVSGVRLENRCRPRFRNKTNQQQFRRCSHERKLYESGF